MPRVYAIASLSFAACLAGCAFPAEFKDVPPAGGRSIIDHGSAFGISTGDSREAAHKTLQDRYGRFKFIYSDCLAPRGFMQRNTLAAKAKFAPVDCGDEDLADVYHDSLGPGSLVANIEIVSRGGRVTRIEWWTVRTYFG